MLLLALNRHVHKLLSKASLHLCRKHGFRKCLPMKKQTNKKEVVTSCFTTCTLAQYPATASNVQFDLLCCQPRPVPETLSTRTPCFTPQCPCGLPAWLGRAINMHDPGKCNLHLLPSSKVTGISPLFTLVLTSSIRK